MKLSRVLTALLCLASISISFAAGTTAHCSWTAPTSYNDGSPLPTTDIDHYTLSWAPANGQAGPTGSQNVPADALAAQINVPCGAVSFTVSVTTTPSAKYPNATSAPTNTVPYATGVACIPNPPGGLAAQ